MIKIKNFSDNELNQLFDLMELCKVPNFYIVKEEKRKFYEDMASNDISICAVDDDKLIAIMLFCFSVDSLEPLINKSEILENLYNSSRWNNGCELMNSCVHPNYRGNHLERTLVEEAIKKSKILTPDVWFWATVHKDNIASQKAALDNGLKLILSDITMPYADHRNLYVSV